MSKSSKSVLLIAFQFPPFTGSSGVQRVLRFAQYLPRYGWSPIVLTVRPHAYEKVTPISGDDIPGDLPVYRAFGLDAARHLGLFGRYPGALAIPDRWATWRPFAVRAARKLIVKHDIRVIWSTFPIATAHAIGREVSQESGLPWIAEFRDPMWQGDYPADPRVNRAWHELEHEVILRATEVVVTTPGAKSLYLERYRISDPQRIQVIHNGYDESAFQRATQQPEPDLQHYKRPITLLHSGVIYPSERDPSKLFAAIAGLKIQGALSSRDLQVVLRATGSDDVYTQMVSQQGIGDIVRIEPSIDYQAALREMMSVDGLLILQASNCNAQVPAKLYEYLRAGRPILALTDPVGDTAALLGEAGTGLVARLDSQKDIESVLRQFIAEVRDGTWKKPCEAVVQSWSREAQAGQLAERFNAVSGARTK